MALECRGQPLAPAAKKAAAVEAAVEQTTEGKKGAAGQRAEEEKATTNKLRDGAKLSFKEKMQLFATEAGENAPRDKAKISKAQRNIEGEEQEMRD